MYIYKDVHYKYNVQFNNNKNNFLRHFQLSRLKLFWSLGVLCGDIVEIGTIFSRCQRGKATKYPPHPPAPRHFNLRLQTKITTPIE